MPTHDARKWTPISIAVLSVCLAAGFGFLGWCGDTAVKALNTQFITIEEKQDITFKAISSIKDKENSDVLCLTRNIGECCGARANFNC